MSRASTFALRAVIALLPACDWCDPTRSPIAHVCSSLDAGLDGGVDAAPKLDAGVQYKCILPLSTEAGDMQPPSDADPYEPNDSFVMASAPKYKSECGPITKSAAIHDVNDVDVFRTAECIATYVPFVPLATNEMYPWAEIDKSDLRVCVFPVCSDGSLHIAGCYESVGKAADPTDKTSQVDEITSPAGFRGCCRTGSGRITAYVDCPRASPKIDTYIWVDSTNADVQGESYNVRWDVDYDMP